MKRTHSKRNKEKKAEIRRLVFEQLRKMRQKMKREHPGMLENMREILEKKNKQKAPQNTAPIAAQRANADTAVDQEKNIEAIEKMLALKEGGNPGFEKAVQALLNKDK